MWISVYLKIKFELGTIHSLISILVPKGNNCQPLLLTTFQMLKGIFQEVIIEILDEIYLLKLKDISLL
jgi:hypothetical protein